LDTLFTSSSASDVRSTRVRGTRSTIVSLIVHACFVALLLYRRETAPPPPPPQQQVVKLTDAPTPAPLPPPPPVPVERKSDTPPAARDEPPAPITAPTQIVKLGEAIAPDEVKIPSFRISDLVELIPSADVEAVLARKGASLGFGLEQEGYITTRFDPPQWTKYDYSPSHGMARDYCSFTLNGDWPLFSRIAAANHVGASAWRYILFPEMFCREARVIVKEAAGKNGYACVKRAQLVFDARQASGFLVRQIEQCEAAAPGSPK
jgi:hypothetical protein